MTETIIIAILSFIGTLLGALDGAKTTHNQTLVIYVPWLKLEDETYGLTSKPWGFEGAYQIVRASGNQ